MIKDFTMIIVCFARDSPRSHSQQEPYEDLPDLSQISDLLSQPNKRHKKNIRLV